jgi:hypothetical protein
VTRQGVCYCGGVGRPQARTGDYNDIDPVQNSLMMAKAFANQTLDSIASDGGFIDLAGYS